MKSFLIFLRRTFVFTSLALSLLIFSTGIASANMTHKQVKGTINERPGCPMMKMMSAKTAGCPMMKMMSAKTAGCPMMKMMGMMNSEKHNMEMNKKM